VLATHPTTLQRYRGALLGFAVGDALGAPLQYLSRSEVRSRHPRPLRELVAGGPLTRAAGAPTDDTQVMLVLARSLLATRRFEPAAAAEALLDWYSGGPLEVGSLVARALDLLERGEPWDWAGRLAWEESECLAAGSGALKRLPALALLLRGRPVELARASRACSAITHYDPRCQDAAAVYCLLLAHFLSGGSRPHTLGVALAVAGQPALRAALLALPELAEADVQAGGYVVEMLQAALWSFLQAPDAETAIVTAANLGGMSDTVAALVGALAGAYWGVAALPPRWLHSLHGREELERVADALLALSEQQP